MLFHKSDRENIHNIMSASEGNRVQLHKISSEVLELVSLCKRLENIIEHLCNDFDLIKNRMIALENKIIPKLAPPPTSIKTTSRKK